MKLVQLSRIDILFLIVYIIALICYLITIFLHGNHEIGEVNTIEKWSDRFYEKETKASNLPKEWKKVYRVLFSLEISMIFLSIVIHSIFFSNRENWISIIFHAVGLLGVLCVVIMCFISRDHNFTYTEEYWILLLGGFYSLRYLPILPSKNQVYIWLTKFPEGIEVVLRLLIWTFQFFLMFSFFGLAINGLLKKNDKIKEIKETYFCKDCNLFYISLLKKNRIFYIFLPIAVIINAMILFFQVVTRAILSMINVLQRVMYKIAIYQKSVYDTQIIRMACRISIVVSLALLFITMKLRKYVYSDSTREIFEFFATVIIIPIVLDGVINLRNRIKQQKNNGE